jgi:DNA polymerase-4
VIAHLDIDAFFAAVEMHRRPELRGRPLVVGGDPHGRGVVATANYAAREFGIRSAMSAAEAVRRCPDVVIVPPDIAHYREWSARVWELVRGMSSAVEVLGLDEGYLELPDDDAGAAADAIRVAVGREVRLSCSLGVATCKVVAKVASDHDKPGGVTVVAPGGEAAFLAPMPVRALDDEGLRAVAGGRNGEDLRRRARGIDPRRVESVPAERISISSERTFAQDVRDGTELEAIACELAEQVAGVLRRRERAARTVTVKLRYADFSTVTRGWTVRAATDDAASIQQTACALLRRALAERAGPLRLMGVGVSGLSSERQLTLF